MSATVPDAALALQRLYHWERHAPERIALSQPARGELHDIRWAEAVGQARRMAAHLLALGLPRGSCIAILGKNSAHWLIADWAIWMAGHVSVPLYPTLAAATVRQVLEHSGARLLFVGKLDLWAEMKSGVPAGLPCIELPLGPGSGAPRWDDIVACTPPLAGEPVRAGDELCTVMYTSGTTGAPKGVMHSFQHFAWGLQAGLKRIGGLDADARMLSYLPLSHVAERTLVEHGQLHGGLRVYFADTLDTFAEDLRRARPTVFFSVPRLWLKFQQGVHARMAPGKLNTMLALPGLGRVVRRKVLEGLGLDACRFAAGGAAPMPPDLLRWYARLGLDLVEVYGMTENCGISHATLPGQPRPGTVGQPYDGVEARIDATSGEIQMRSPALMLGYFREPELTQEAISADGWLHTGDQGELDAGGNLRITGRVKDLFKTSKGKYVAPAPIEDKLVMHPAVEACCVSGAHLHQPLGLLMLNPAAAAQADDADGRAALERSLADHLDTVNSLLDPHERLACVVLMRDAWTVGNDLVTPTFKVKRGRIEALFARHYDQWAGSGRKLVWYDAPR
ncbi:AMP-binding protein [Rubrivivax gelatinosus]|uniref:AMP-binding acetyl-CoA synthetase n=1 Tax=Rubrivivax gelatinosus TaxID=28068 RepID=A0ABS1DWG7_RUBGE|nr:AMP-binding protein [Rubrivivax gelatinosus]MBK1714073.1 AMP-binding acetyl-CoA synthetase [Rubrivivax gelatinosus]